MKHAIIVLTFAAAVIGLAPSAQTVDQPMADQPLLNAEFERCKQLGIAAVDDIRRISAAARPTRPTCQ